MSAPPPPPPPPAIAKKAPVPLPGPQPPAVASTGPPGDFLVELLIFNGAPFKDHWAYWVRSHNKPEKGVLIHARGDVRNGFELQTSRAHDFELTGTVPMKRIPLQWVNGKHFDEKLMMNSGVHKFDVIPVCSFEASAFKVPAPGKTLNAVNEDVSFCPFVAPALLVAAV